MEKCKISNLTSGLDQVSVACYECPIESLTCPIAHGVVWGCSGFLHARNLTETLNDVTFKVSTLVAVYSGRETIVDDVVSPQYFGRCSCRLVSGREGLCIPREVVCYNQDIADPALGLL